jgi:hypothetical protein
MLKTAVVAQPFLIPFERQVEIIEHGGNTFTLIAPLRDSVQESHLEAVRFDGEGKLVSRSSIARNFAVSQIVRHGKVSRSHPVAPSGLVFKFDEDARLVDSISLRDTANCSAEGSLTRVDAIFPTDAGIHIAGAQACVSDDAGRKEAYDTLIYAVLGDDLRIKHSRKVMLERQFTVAGLLPVGGGAVLYGAARTGFPTVRSQIVRLGPASIDWKTEIPTNDVLFDDRLRQIPSGALLWCGWKGTCHMIDPGSGSMLDSSKSEQAFGKVRQAIGIGGNEFIFMGIALEMRLERVRFENISTAIRPSSNRPYKGNPRRFARPDGRRLLESPPPRSVRPARTNRTGPS